MRCRRVAELLRAVSRFAIVGVVGGVAGACSSDTLRFTENPFANPYSAQRTATAGRTPDPSMTGSLGAPGGVATANGAAMPSSRVTSSPLAPVGASSSAPHLVDAPSVTTPMPHESYASSTGGPGWSATGGTAVTVSPGDSLSAISNRYGVPPAAILSANGIAAGQVAPGRRLIIPIYNASGPNVVARAPKPAPQPVPEVARATPQPVAHVAAAPTKAPMRIIEARKAVIEPKTTASVDTKTHPRPGRPAMLAKSEAAPVKPAAPKIAATKIAAPKVAVARVAAPKVAAPKVVAANVAVAKPAQPEPVRKVAKVEAAPVALPAKPIKVAQPAKPAKPEPQRVAALAPAKTVQPEPVSAPKEPESTGALPAQPTVAKAEFRWPARGRVISGFGGTGTNEGINISVPDGTPVKAAEAGTVAYAGSEVKGYGNLVLIRHENGYVSAYAHNGDLDVKRGQKVARGQVIAKSGQSGNVTSPQLHFEIRKGATPIDPMPYLASN